MSNSTAGRQQLPHGQHVPAAELLGKYTDPESTWDQSTRPAPGKELNAKQISPDYSDHPGKRELPLIPIQLILKKPPKYKRKLELVPCVPCFTDLPSPVPEHEVSKPLARGTFCPMVTGAGPGTAAPRAQQSLCQAGPATPPALMEINPQ